MRAIFGGGKIWQLGNDEQFTCSKITANDNGSPYSSAIAHMNKLMAILFFFGAIGGFGLSQRDSYRTQNQTKGGAPVGEIRTVHITPGDKIGYVACGAVCMAACLYFVTRIGRDASRS